MNQAAGWGAPAHVSAFTTPRSGGVSQPPYDSLNLALHVGDDADSVRRNRLILKQSNGWDSEPLWLEQVHGNDVVRAEDVQPGEVPRADGAVTTEPGRGLAILTADCLPVLACNHAGTVIGAFHAGWRGLLAGVLERGLAVMNTPPADVLVWMGPAIAAASYQVGPEVRRAYLASDPDHQADFADDGPGHWRFDLAGAAVRRLKRLGVVSMSVSYRDTLSEPDLFFSHRRQAPCGRMATIIRIERKS